MNNAKYIIPHAEISCLELEHNYKLDWLKSIYDRFKEEHPRRISDNLIFLWKSDFDKLSVEK